MLLYTDTRPIGFDQIDHFLKILHSSILCSLMLLKIHQSGILRVLFGCYKAAAVSVHILCTLSVH